MPTGLPPRKTIGTDASGPTTRRGQTRGLRLPLSLEEWSSWGLSVLSSTAKLPSLINLLSLWLSAPSLAEDLGGLSVDCHGSFSAMVSWSLCPGVEAKGQVCVCVFAVENLTLKAFPYYIP